MKTTLSADGTRIGFDKEGEGPPVILLAGAFNDRSTTAPLVAALQSDFTVLNADRRGRGSSGDTPPYAVDREIEDLDALISEAGGSACVFGYSSGPLLALMAAADSLPIVKLALYEPPILIDDSRPRPPANLADELAELISAERRGDAVELYQTEGVGLPADVVDQLCDAPFRPRLEAIAHTLAYDAAITGDLSLPNDVVSAVSTPTLVIDGEDSWPFLRAGAAAVADGLTNGVLCSLAGQTHDIDPEVTAAALERFFAD